MDKLPLEIKEHIVSRMIWAPERFDPKRERWEDGLLRLELVEFHPLRHYLGHKVWNGRRPRPTDAETSIAALMGTSKELKRICERITRQLLSAYATLDYCCKCEHQSVDHDCADVDHDCNDLEPHWGLSILRGTPNAHTKVLNVVDVQSGYLEELYYGSWPRPSPAEFASLRECSGLAALSSNGQTLPWLTHILNALPDHGAKLKQLMIAYPDRVEDPSDAELKSIVVALRRCTSLEVLDLQHDWDYDRPDSNKATVFALHVLKSLLRLSAVRMSSFMGAGSLGGKTTVSILQQQPLALPITRLAIECCDLEAGVLRTLVESCSEALEYLASNETLFFPNEPVHAGVQPAPATKRFPRLRYVILAQPGWLDEMEFGPSIFPAHWELPAIRHFDAAFVGLEESGSIKTFTDRLHSWKTLEYLQVRGLWTYAALSEDIAGQQSLEEKEEDEDSPLQWASKLQSILRQGGVDATLSLDGPF